MGSTALATAGLDHEVLLTTRALEAADLARDAARDGVALVVAVGGDGTLHEVVNGSSRRTCPPSDRRWGSCRPGGAATTHGAWACLTTP